MSRAFRPDAGSVSELPRLLPETTYNVEFFLLIVFSTKYYMFCSKREIKDVTPGLVIS
jgi:hypothetical protein